MTTRLKRPWPQNANLRQALERWRDLKNGEREQWLARYRKGELGHLRDWEAAILRRADDVERAVEIAPSARPAKTRPPGPIPTPQRKQANEGVGITHADAAKIADALIARLSGSTELAEIREAFGKAGITAAERGRLIARYKQLLAVQPSASKILTKLTK